LGNITNSTFLIDIMVAVSPSFTGFIVNNATVYFSQPNGTVENVSALAITTIISPSPPPIGGSGGGSASGAGLCPPFNAIQRKVNGQTVTFYTCCVDSDCARVWGLGGYVCGSSQAMLAAPVCIPAPPESLAYSDGVCPVQRTCGTLCCAIGQVCTNGRCVITRQPEILVPFVPKAEEGYVILGVQETSVLWLLLLIILAIILLIMLAILASLGNEKKKRLHKK
jgi:hypothetical protein